MCSVVPVARLTAAPRPAHRPVTRHRGPSAVAQAPFFALGWTYVAPLRDDHGTRHRRHPGAQAQSIAQNSVVQLPASVREGGDPERASRLQGLCEGLLGNLATEANFEHQIGELRLASGNVTQFRQALFMLMKMHGVTGPVRNVLMARAMAWFRARAQVEGQGAQPWAKSFVQIAENYAGRWV